MTAAAALRHKLCPRCRQGPIYAARDMHPQCPVCAMRFEREPGYFIFAMYISYAISLPVVSALFLLFWWGFSLRAPFALLAAAALYLPFVRRLVRVSRIAWIHLDYFLDPEKTR